MEKTSFSNIPKKLPKYLSKEEINTVLDKVNHDNNKHGRRNYLMLFCLWRTGMRVSDLVHLKKSDLKEDTIIIRQGKGKKDRVIPFNHELRNLLLTYADTMDKDQILFNLQRRQINNIIKKYNPDIHAHTFRHSFSVHYLKSGGNLRSLQLILGHSCLNVTEKYLILSGIDVRNDYNKILW